jgi:hypothetical protein
VLLNKKDGNFTIAPQNQFAQLTGIQFITNISANDIDHNGTDDIIISAEWQPIQIFLNKNKKLNEILIATA